MSDSKTEGDPDWARIRAQFPAVRERAYLNTASYGPGPTPVLDEVHAAIEAWSSGTGSWRVWEDRAEESRALFARFLSVEADGVALLPSLSAAAGQVAASLPAPNGRANLVVGADEFRSNLFPWMNQERRGFELRPVPFRDGRLPAEDVASAIDDDTVLVAVSHVQSATGYRIDLPRLAEACAPRPARLFVDATQSLGALRIPMEGVDFVATAAYKWLLSPRGAAFLWTSPERFPEQIPIMPSWKTPTDPYADYYGGPFDCAPRASSLDGSLAWPVWQGTTRALELLNEIGPATIERRDLELATRFRNGLPRLGLTPLFEERESSPIVALRIPNAPAVEEALAREGVIAAVRSGYLRMSFHFFNDENDVDRALAALSGA